MRYFVISLQRTPQRLESFYAANGHRDRIEHFVAVDGRSVDRDALVASGIVDPALDTYSPGALGCAMSHAALWSRCAQLGEAFTIFEDDAILHPSFFDKSSELLGASPWKYVQWGWNFDAALQFVLPGSLGECLNLFNPKAIASGIKEFCAAKATSQLFRLASLFGTVAYSVTPEAAREMLAICFPLRPQSVFFPSGSGGFTMPNSGIDVQLNAYFRHPISNAQVAFPPLVVTPNVHEESTTVAS